MKKFLVPDPKEAAENAAAAAAFNSGHTKSVHKAGRSYIVREWDGRDLAAFYPEPASYAKGRQILGGNGFQRLDLIRASCKELQQALAAAARLGWVDASTGGPQRTGGELTDLICTECRQGHNTMLRNAYSAARMQVRFNERSYT